MTNAVSIASLGGATSADSSANFQFNSGYGSVATAYGCRAWVNFDGTGTVAIRASGNVSSITDNGTGDYTVNFSTAMPNANYSAVATASDTPTINRFTTLYQGFVLAGSVRLVVCGANTVPADVITVCVSVFR